MRRGDVLPLWMLYGLLTSVLAVSIGQVWAEPWQEVRSKHFIIFYVDEQDASLARDAAEWAEFYYQQIRFDLGLRHVISPDRKLWLWNQRCRMYLYPNRATYLQATKAPGWSVGMVRYRQRTVYSFAGSNNFLESLLPHELAHILFREFVGFDNPLVPRWLDEGVAQYAEVERTQLALTTMRQAIDQGRYLPLTHLDQMAVNQTHGETAHLFYAQAASLVAFFIESYGNRRFVRLCGQLRDGYPLERALSVATSGRLRSLADLEDAWLRYLEQRT